MNGTPSQTLAVITENFAQVGSPRKAGGLLTPSFWSRRSRKP